MTTVEANSLGEYLRHERERRGITIEQVASATRIGVRTLHSLESDQYAELPARPFIRGFVISYCRFIGLDAKEVLSSYTDFINTKASERPNRERGHSGYAFEKRDGEQQSRTFLFVAIFTFMVVGAVAVLVLKPSLQHKRNSHLDRLRAAHVQGSDKKGLEIGPPVSTVEPALPLNIPGVSTPAVPAASSGTPSGASATEEAAPKGKLTPPVAETAPASAAPPAPAVPAVKEKTPPAQSSQVDAPKEKPVKPSDSAGAQLTSESSPDSSSRQEPGSDPKDPLDSGLSLSSKDIKHRVVFKVDQDVWVRYQADGRPVRKFVIRSGKTLVLRAKDKIVFQVSNPESVEFSYGGGGYKPMAEGKMVMRQGEATLFFPADVGKSVQQPFADSHPLPKAVGPKP